MGTGYFGVFSALLCPPAPSASSPAEQSLAGNEAGAEDHGAGKGLEPQERLRELGKGLRLEQRRLRGALVALHKSLTGGGSRGGSGSARREQGQEDKGKWPQAVLGRFGLGIRVDSFPERAASIPAPSWTLPAMPGTALNAELC